MSALAHYIEAAGIPTVLIALVREHAAAIKPPRALWVSFELGRPLGAPENPAFQRRALDAALALLARPSGPVLEDFPEDAPAEAGDAGADEGWVCPVSFARPAQGAPETHRARVAAETAQLRPWHETWKRRHGATGVGVSGCDIDALAAFIAGYADGRDVASPIEGADIADALKLAVGDLMTFYQEAANAQPGAPGGSQAVSDWFWGETAAGKALLGVRRRGMGSEDPRLKRLAGGLILPHGALKYLD